MCKCEHADIDHRFTCSVCGQKVDLYSTTSLLKRVICLDCYPKVVKRIENFVDIIFGSDEDFEKYLAEETTIQELKEESSQLHEEIDEMTKRIDLLFHKYDRLWHEVEGRPV